MELITRREALAQGLTHYFTGKPCKHGHVATRRCDTRLCTECIKTRHRPRDYAANRKRYIKNAIDWNKKNPERAAAHYKANMDRRIATGQHQALVQKRRCKLASQTPDLTAAESAKIAQFYRVARALTQRTGLAHEVDHVIPISRGGLHHPSNLQILLQADNRSKGAKMTA